MLAAAVSYVPYPSWLNPGDNTWQMTAATFVGLMSLPGLAVLYASIVPKKWAVNVLGMMFAGFSLVMLAWFLWAYKMGFGANSFGGGVKNGVADPAHRGRWVDTLLRQLPRQTGAHRQSSGRTGPGGVGGQHHHPLPLPDGVAGLLPVRVRGHHPAAVPGERARVGSSSAPGASWCRCGRPASTRSTPSCCGAAATSPRRARSTSPAGTSSTCRPVCPDSWPPGSSAPGCSGTDNTSCPTTWSWRRSVPASCGSAGTASTVVTRTTREPARPAPWSTPTWPPRPACSPGSRWDAWVSKEKKPTFLGAVNGMICGLVGITPCAGWVNGTGAILIGLICSSIVWVAWNFLSKVRPFSKVDDALGVVYTHGIAGLLRRSAPRPLR